MSNDYVGICKKVSVACFSADPSVQTFILWYWGKIIVEGCPDEIRIRHLQNKAYTFTTKSVSFMRTYIIELLKAAYDGAYLQFSALFGEIRGKWANEVYPQWCRFTLWSSGSWSFLIW